jgi:hypothetical protein
MMNLALTHPHTVTHALLVLRHCGHAVRELQAQQSDSGQKHQHFLAHHARSTLCGLDA